MVGVGTRTPKKTGVLGVLGPLVLGGGLAAPSQAGYVAEDWCSSHSISSLRTSRAMGDDLLGLQDLLGYAAFVVELHELLLLVLEGS